MERLESSSSSPPKKRRIPKACASCRTSKVKCDGGKPCKRCTTSGAHCDYMQPIKDPITQKLEQIEEQMQYLTSRVQPDSSTALALLQLQQQQQEQQINPPQHQSQHQNRATSTSLYGATTYEVDFQQPLTIPQTDISQAPVSPEENTLFSGRRPPPHPASHIRYPQPLSSEMQTQPGLSPRSQSQWGGSGVGGSSGKRKRGDFEIKEELGTDNISKGLLTYDDAMVYFTAFFEGCDRYVPVFDVRIDTFESVRARSSMLFDVICAVGCRAEQGPVSTQYQMLSNTTKGPICDVILGLIPPSIETIQALLVNASYTEKGWILTSMAIKMGLDLDLPSAYSELASIMLGRQFSGQVDEASSQREEFLFHRSRVWFGAFVLENILSIDCGKKPGVVAIDGMRRCRVLLKHPLRTWIDLRLLSQVELNCIRALAHERLSNGSISDQELGEIAQNTRLDLSIWLSDWINIVETSIMDEDQRASLIINFKIQRDWGEMTMLCKGLQGTGIENVAIMSEEQRNLVNLARSSAQRHLTTIVSDPGVYLGAFRFGMDFVWAKCAFSVLLLLKLTRVIPGTTNMSQIIADAKILLSELSKARASNHIYFRILTLSVEKCEAALKEDLGQAQNGTRFPSLNRDYVEPETDIQSYVPKEFVLDWSFPGLTFCWIPFDFQDMFLDFGATS